jgi:hypothetical protein
MGVFIVIFWDMASSAIFVSGEAFPKFQFPGRPPWIYYTGIMAGVLKYAVNNPDILA